MNREDISDEELTLYVLGLLPVGRSGAIQAQIVSDPVLHDRVVDQELGAERWVLRSAQTPRAATREHLLKRLDTEIAQARASGRPPVMHERSTPAEFAAWTDTAEMVFPEDAEIYHLIPIDLTKDRQTGLVWIKELHPEEVHTDCVERIMILEGTCDVHIGEKVIPMSPGQVITIPMHMPHHVRVTSGGWCKAIVQRITA